MKIIDLGLLCMVVVGAIVMFYGLWSIEKTTQHVCKPIPHDYCDSFVYPNAQGEE